MIWPILFDGMARLCAVAIASIGLSSMGLSIASANEHWKKLHFVEGCRVFRWNGQPTKRFPGTWCLFLSDGRFLSATSSELTMYRPGEQKLWSKAGDFHHQMNLSRDGKSVLILGSIEKSVEGQVVRYDEFLRISLTDGSVVSRISADKLFDSHRLTVPAYAHNPVGTNIKAVVEIGHFNSIRELGPNALEKGDSRFHPGNIVINSSGLGIFILNPEMTRSVFFKRFKHADIHKVHDVQMLPSGRFLYFNNRNGDRSRGPYSSVDIVEPLTDRRTFHFVASPPQMLYTPVRGGVRPIGSFLLVSDPVRGYFLIDSRNGKLVYANPEFALDPISATPTFIDTVWAEDLSLFLRSWL